MKKWVMVLMLCLACSFAYGITDSRHVWHVAKDGNDSNPGHAQQYPIDLAQDAFLTISKAVADACDGDTIIIWPGDYEETVNLDSANKSLTLIGTNRHKCRIVRSGTLTFHGIIVEDGTTLKNLSVSIPDGDSSGIQANSKSDIVIENCNIWSAYDGFISDGCRRVSISNSTIGCRYDGLVTNSKQVNVTNCHIYTDSSKAGGYARAVYLAGEAHIQFNHCVIEGWADENYTGNVVGIYLQDEEIKAAVNNSTIITSTDGTGTAYDIYNKEEGIIYVDGTFYTTSYGTITED